MTSISFKSVEPAAQERNSLVKNNAKWNHHLKPKYQRGQPVYTNSLESFMSYYEFRYDEKD